MRQDDGTDARADRPVALPKRLPEMLPHVAEQPLRARPRRVGQEQREFVAAETSDAIRLPKTSSERVRHGTQNSISLGVTERVVNRLEVVEIDVGDRDRPPLATGEIQLVVADLRERTSVQRPGQAVGARQLVLAREMAPQNDQQGARRGEEAEPHEGVPIRNQPMAVWVTGSQVDEEPGRRRCGAEEDARSPSAVPAAERDRGEIEHGDRKLVAAREVQRADSSQEEKRHRGDGGSVPPAESPVQSLQHRRGA